METEDVNYIKSLKRKILFLQFVIIAIVIVIILVIVAGYIYAKPYIEKFNELVIAFKNIQPYLSKLDQLNQLNQLAGSAKDLQPALETLKSLAGDLKTIQSTTNLIKSNLQGFTSFFGK